MTQAIQVQRISKTFGPIQALRNVSFEVPSESVFCILGPNGAGKTTLLRILTTVTRPDTGEVHIEGLNIVHQTLAVRERIGIVAQENRFDRYLSVWHNLTLHAEMHGLTRAQYEPRITELLQSVGLYDRRFSMPDDLSGGMQRRIALIRALIHRPHVLFLDEPTTGLDPEARLEIWQTIEQFKRSATVILTTHYMEEADRLSDAILMLNHGRIVSQGTAQMLKQAISPLNQYELVLKLPKAEHYARLFASMADTALAQVQITHANRLVLQVPRPEMLEPVIQHLDPADLLRLGQIEANLEDVFLTVTGTSSTTSQEDQG